MKNSTNHQPTEPQDRKHAVASLANLYRIFTIPESPHSTLGQIDQQISANLSGFLRDNIVTTEEDLAIIERDFSDPEIPEQPTFVSDYTEFLMSSLVAQSVHTAAPGFVGHMTSALPNFMLPLSRIMTALNQNLVKIETSKAFTPLERQVLGMLHRLIYERNDDYYQSWLHDRNTALGAFCSGGTLANITALWVARNNLFPACEGFNGVAREGMHRALKQYDYEDVAILISRRGHYSFSKTVDVLGIGRDNLIAIDTDDNNRIKINELRETCRRLEGEGTKVMSLIGVAGTTETGNVDTLNEMADIAAEFKCNYHVDAAWGGPTLFSETHKSLLSGIERADSVTIDAHKQLYVPMGAGMVLFKDPASVASIEQHAEYILRKGSKDLGSHTLEGSRPGTAMLVHSAINIIGRKGFEILIDQGISKASCFAGMIRDDEDFELVTEPELNILTYRYVPKEIQQKLQQADATQTEKINQLLDRLTKGIQKSQRAAGRSFVSRTRLVPPGEHSKTITVFRVVLANPLTTQKTLLNMLLEQKSIVMDSPYLQDLIAPLFE